MPTEGLAPDVSSSFISFQSVHHKVLAKIIVLIFSILICSFFSVLSGGVEVNQSWAKMLIDLKDHDQTTEKPFEKKIPSKDHSKEVIH